ncbi:MAG TPA: quinone oxidoreductase [Magnetospirillaceae bacterium]|jgi:NADPH2:quinone reductase
MTKAIRIHATGGPEVMKWEDIEVGAPGPGQALVRHTAVGFNFIDIYHRNGLYPLPLPHPIGMEGAGIIEALGKGVKDLKIGQRVAYAGGTPGSYSEKRLIAADQLVAVPSGIKDEEAAAMMLKGMTAEYLLRRTYKVKKGDTILIHAAAGGVGLIVCQWAKALGAKVIGTVSTDEKAALAKKHGCHYPIVTAKEDFVARVNAITKGKGVPVVYDSVGVDTFDKSLECIAKRGVLALFGQSSGAVPPVPTTTLVKRGIFLTRPSLFTYNGTREELVASSRALFGAVKSGKVKIRINHTYPLADAAKAHEDVAARKTTGSVILTL